MGNKFLKLVLNKNKSKKSFILNKKEGSVSSLITGLMFLMIIIILIMFNFRVTMLSEVFYNIDDALTASTLGASTPNTNAYIGSASFPEQGQLILQDTLTETSYVNYKQGDVSGVKYNEQVIVMSELNSSLIDTGRHEAAKLTDPDNIKYPEDAEALKRLGFTSGTVNGSEFDSYVAYKTTNRTVQGNEVYTLKVVNNLLGSTYTNFTQSTVAAPKLTTLGSESTLKNNFRIDKNAVLNKAFLGNYLNTDINITRLEIYDVYRYTLAERHIYASPYMTYTVNGTAGYTWDGYSLTGVASTKPKITLSDGTQTNAVMDMVNATAKGVATTINGTACTKASGIDIQVTGFCKYKVEDDGVAGNDNDFKDLMQQLYPAMIIPDREPDYLGDDTLPDSYYDMYYMLRALWRLDLATWNARAEYPLIFWEDTGITHQTTWWANNNGLKDIYGYLWNNDSQKVIKITDSILTTDASGRTLLPIEGYSTYAYVIDKGITSSYNNLSVLTDSTSGSLSKKKQFIVLGDFSADSSIDDKSTAGKVYEHRKRDAKLYYSAVYIEIAFDVIGFPRNSTDPNTTDSFLNLAKFSTHPVTQARLVSITKGD